MSLMSNKHAIVCSTTAQDTTTAETVTKKFKLQGGHNTGAMVTEFYRTSQETGGESHLEEAPPTPLAVDYLKNASMAADSESAGYLLFWGSNGSGDTTAQLPTTSTVYEHIYTGPTQIGYPLAFSMEDQGDPATTDADFNTTVHNVTPERVVIAGRRRGVITVAADLRGGKTVGNTGAPTAGTYTRNRLFNFGMTHCFTTSYDSAGTALSAGTTFLGNAGDLSADATCLAATKLSATARTITAFIQEFQIISTQSLDLQRSMAPGNLTSTYAGYVPTQTDWVFTPEQQQMEFEMVFNQNPAADSNSIIEGLKGEYEAGTQRGFEIWLVHPNKVESGAADAFYGIKVTCPNMAPVTWAEENDGISGDRYVRVRYRATWNTTDNVGWHVAFSNSDVTAYGS